jgi:4-hydroxy-tetrahydrodipicolinate synthase
MFSGAITALITPFKDGQIDEARLRANVDAQIAAGISGLVPCGTTGESPTLSHEEHDRVIEIVVEQAAGRVPVIAGAGSNNTAEALRLTRHAKEVGVAATLQVTGYYNKPSQEGQYRHFMSLADQVDLPIVLYNIPGRCVVGLEAETVARLADHPNIVAIKEATGSLEMASDIASLCDLTIISGDDALTLPLMSVGGKGVISVLSNLLPDRMAALTKAGLEGDFAEALKIHKEIFPLCKACLKLAVNPVTIKTALELLGRDTGEVRLPLVEMPAENRTKLEVLLKPQGLLD